MVKRKGYQTVDDTNSAIDSYENDRSRLTPTNNAIRNLAKTRERIIPIDIFSIFPDPSQPRRVIPAAVRDNWDYDTSPNGMKKLFEDWVDYVAGQSDVDSELLWGMLNARVNGGDIGDEDDDEVIQYPEIIRNLMSIGNLAGDIYNHGLTNPVSIYTVAEEIRNSDGEVIEPEQYMIETGERRWLAYHLLYLYEGKSWRNIQARKMESLSVWRQAGENNVRNDLNAISKARQFALLLIDLIQSTSKKDSALVDEIKPKHEFDREQDFYAQVADGGKYRVPRGQGERLLSAMGLSNSSQLRRYRAILRIPWEVWVEADDNNWTEWQIRDYTVPDGTVSGRDEGNDVDHLSASSLDDKTPAPASSASRIEVITRDDVFTQARRLVSDYESEHDELKALSDVLSVVRKRIKYLKAQSSEGTGDE